MRNSKIGEKINFELADDFLTHMGAVFDLHFSNFKQANIKIKDLHPGYIEGFVREIPFNTQIADAATQKMQLMNGFDKDTLLNAIDLAARKFSMQGSLAVLKNKGVPRLFFSIPNPFYNRRREQLNIATRILKETIAKLYADAARTHLASLGIFIMGVTVSLFAAMRVSELDGDI